MLTNVPDDVRSSVRMKLRPGLSTSYLKDRTNHKHKAIYHTLPVYYHVPFFGSPILGLGSYSRQVGYTKKGYGMSLQVLQVP